jgi:hypothetical protein
MAVATAQLVVYFSRYVNISTGTTGNHYQQPRSLERGSGTAFDLFEVDTVYF